MSAFICARCDNLRDADDGCDDAPRELGGGSPSWRLVCTECAEEIEAEREESAPLPSDIDRENEASLRSMATLFGKSDNPFLNAAAVTLQGQAELMRFAGLPLEDLIDGGQL